MKILKSDILCASDSSTQHQTEIVGSWNADEKNDLFQTSFRHHVIERPFKTHFKVPDGALTDEKVTHMFHSSFYSVELFVGYRGNKSISVDKFFNKFSESPINIDSETSQRLGPNKIAAIIGKVGTGKSTFLSQLLVRNFQKFKRDEIMALRVDVEEFAGRAAKKSLFFRNLFHQLQTEVFNLDGSDHAFWQEQFFSMAPAEEAAGDETIALQYMFAIKSLFVSVREKYGLRGMIFLDNLDKYYYLFDRASFSPEGEKLRAAGMAKLSSILSEFEAPAGRLDGAGLCVLVALRRHTLDYLNESNHPSPFNAMNLDELANSSVFRLSPKSALQIVNSRLNLIRKLGDISLNNARQNDALETLKVIEREWRAAYDPLLSTSRKRSRNMVSDLGRFMHHGHRSLVDHLGKYKWAMSDPIAFRRIFKSYSPAILLFMLQNKQRYSQVMCRFPNIFLVRGEMNSDAESTTPPRLKQPHKHTYWLKYLILEYIYTRNEQRKSVTKQDIMEVFCRGDVSEGYYEEHIVELVLGSLAQVDGSFCIDVQYGTNLEGTGIGISKVNLSERGRFLVERFAFDFTYLQLVVEDYMLELPCGKEFEEWRSEFLLPDHLHYNYLVEKFEDYANSAGLMVSVKTRMVAQFLEVLKASLKAEALRRKAVFEHFAERGGKLPDFEKIETRVISTVNNVLDHITGFEASVSPEDAFANARLNGPKLEDFFHDAYCIKDV